MKRFLKYIGTLLLILLGWQLIGEFAYTYVYEHGSPRNKVMWVRSLEEDHLDFAILGSSRAQFHVDPLIIEEEKGWYGYNFGYENCYPFETNLMAQELLKHTSTERLWVQVDFTYNMDIPDVQAQVPWMPYIKEPEIYRHFEPHGRRYTLFKWIPFYRYQYFEGSLGLRNVLLSALGKEPDFYENRGFKGIDHQLQELDVFEHYLEEQENQSLKQLLQTTSEQSVQTSFFIAPIQDFEGNLPIMAQWLPNLKDYTNSFPDASDFSDPIHLRQEAAREFTQLLINDLDP